MTYIGSRLRYLRKLDNVTQQQLADSIGVAKSTISMYENGQREPDFETLEAISDFFNVEMSTFFPGGSGVIPGAMPMPGTYKIPLIGTIACGKPILAVEEADETVETPDFVHADFALRCKGDSMINARIFDGDVVYIRQQPQVENGQIAAVLVGDEATLKRVTVYPDKIVLEPANPMYDPLVFRGDEMNQVEILGKAVAFTSMIE